MLRAPTSTAITLVSLTLALVGACTGERDGEGSTGAAQPSLAAADAGDPERPSAGETGDVEPNPAREHEPDDPRATAVVIAKSSAPAAIAGQGAKSLGFRLDKIVHLFSLAATAKIPDWGAAGQGEAKLARDDDLDTAWRCEFGQAKPCVLGLALPEQAQVEAVRVYLAAGPRYRDFTGHPRVAKLRVHTEAGYVDADLPDTANHLYVRFDAPIATQVLALEVLDVHAGKDDALVQFAEVEIYGTEGAPRQPLELDPDYAYLTWETTAWSGGGGHTIRQVFVNFASPSASGAPPSSRRLLRATAVFGRVGDDYLLFERLHRTDCDEVSGNYVLFDKRNRMFYPLGDLGGAGAAVYRHAGGRGFAVGRIDGGEFTVKGVVEEAGKLEWRRPPKQAPRDGAALLREWGFETEPLGRGQALDAAIPGCHRAALGELDVLVSAAKFADARAQDPSEWIVCEVGADKLYATAPCGAPARAYQLAGRKLVGRFESKHSDARGLRLRRIGDRLMVELSAEQGDTGALLWAEPGALVELGLRGGLFVRPPSDCTVCSDRWTDLGRLAGDDRRDEGWADEGDEDDFADDGNDESLDEDEGDEGDEGDGEPSPPPRPAAPASPSSPPR